MESGRFQALLDKWNGGNGEQRMGDYAFTGERGTLRIATLGTWSPMSFYAGDALTGVFVELMNGFCAANGYRPVFSAMPYASEIAGLNAGEYDVVADNIVRIPERLRPSISPTRCSAMKCSPLSPPYPQGRGPAKGAFSGQ